MAPGRGTRALSLSRELSRRGRALHPAGMSLVAPARPAASELRGSSGRRKGVLLPACPSCAGQDVKSIGTGTRRPNADGTTFYYYRYVCKVCDHKWQEAPPHKRHVPAPARAASKPRKTYTCPECGEILLNSRVPPPTARTAPHSFLGLASVARAACAGAPRASGQGASHRPDPPVPRLWPQLRHRLCA